MDDLEQQINAWADAAAPPTDEAVAAADVIAGRTPAAEAVLAAASPHRRGRWLAAAAVVVVLGAIGVALAVSSDDDAGQQVHASDPPVATTSTTTEPEPATSVPMAPTEVLFEQLGVGVSGENPIGTLAAAQSQDELDALWSDAGLEGTAPPVDFDDQVVVSITVGDDLCPPTLTGFVRNAELVEPRFVEPQGACEQPLVARTYLAALEWTSTGDHFFLVLRNPETEEQEGSIEVTRDGFVVDEGDPDEDAGEPAPGVSSSLTMDATQAAAGGTLTGTVTVVNDSGAPVEGTTCGSYFVASLANDEYAQGVFRNACLGSFTIPEGTSTYPIEVLATVTGCTPVEVEDPDRGFPLCNPDGSMPSFPPGEYQLTIDDPQHLVPAIDPVTITVTPS